jgi:hypothetical protein
MENQNTFANLYISSPVRQVEFFQTEEEALAIQDELIERYITPPSSPRLIEPPVIKRVLIESGAFDDDYPSWTQGQESPESGVPIYRGPAFSPITLPMAEPLVVIAQAQKTITDCIDEIEAWTRSLEALIADSRAIREAPLSAFENLARHDDDDTLSEPNLDEL